MPIDTHLDPAVVRTTTRRRSSRHDQLDLSRNELVHPGLADLVAEALATVPADAATRYPVVDGLLGDIATHLACEPDEIELFPGSDDAIGVLVDGLTRTHRRVLLQDPTYPGYRRAAELHGVDVRSWLPRPGQMRHAVEDGLRGMRRMAASLVVVTDPHGMSGAVAGAAELVSLATAAELGDHLLVVDECYDRFGAQPGHQTLRGHAHVVRVGSFSKALGLAGMRLGYVVAAPPIVDYLRHWRRAEAVSAATLHVAVHLLRQDSVGVARLRADVVAGREWLADQIVKLDGRWCPLPSGANFLAVDIGDADAARQLTGHLADHGIAIRCHEAPAFAPVLQITAAPIETLEPLVAALREFVERLEVWPHEGVGPPDALATTATYPPGDHGQGQ